MKHLPRPGVRLTVYHTSIPDPIISFSFNMPSTTVPEVADMFSLKDSMGNNGYAVLHETKYSIID